MCVLLIRGGSVAEKSWLASRRFRPWSLCRRLRPNPRARALELRVPGDFFSSLLMLCYCVLHVLRRFVHWNCCIKAMCSTVACCTSIVLCNSAVKIVRGVRGPTTSPRVPRKASAASHTPTSSGDSLERHQVPLLSGDTAAAPTRHSR